MDRVDLMELRSIHRLTLISIPPAGSLKDAYLKSAYTRSRGATSHVPTGPPPDPGRDVFHIHTLSCIFLAGRDCVGRDPSVIFSHDYFSRRQLPAQGARWSSVGPPPATAARYCLASSSHGKQRWTPPAFRGRGHMVLRRSKILFPGDGCCVSPLYRYIHKNMQYIEVFINMGARQRKRNGYDRSQRGSRFHSICFFLLDKQQIVCKALCTVWDAAGVNNLPQREGKEEVMKRFGETSTRCTLLE